MTSLRSPAGLRLFCHGRGATRRRRRGAVLLIAMICLLLATVIIASVVRTALVQRERAIRDEWQLQAEWLAESGLDRAVLRTRDAEYAGETWEPVATGETEALGTVEISVDRSDPRATITVVADVPVASAERARVRKQVTLSLPKTSTSDLAP